MLTPSTLLTQYATIVRSYASDYDVGAVLTQHDHLVEYHSETLSNIV
jgi:hypothetical protein